MTDAAEDFDALFDEVSSQRSQAAASSPAPVTQSASVSAEDDLEALFDQVSSQNSTALLVQTATSASLAADEKHPEENQSDKPMFDRLGGIVRQLHDSLRELGYDRSLADIAEHVTDSKGRLEYVATLTEQAANKVLNAIDEGLPAQDALAKKAKDIETRWASLFEGKLSLEEFKTLAGDSKQFAGSVAETTEAEKSRLMEIMMAQDFQDITGQIIKKIVAISSKLEHELAQLLRDNAPPSLHKEKEHKPVDLMSGPSVAASAMAQDDVDDLLANLGF